ncbi:MAG: undecaprenyldiphospho-muramoylpentapeptide beta-N-acetylglucosaminyltransferase [Alphaproteobacteria bacterium]|jgi:UDP-N-acetylglucosamine--N-acetylmuramyl-(pentapeptide) pyrophosphoryl-undecaprenol N-acetylglucosamine transferase|uniref:undecaprenyldiphospho-muramoylpentapeptide beta-N-acetylglucosaminyltransferase n=1 Tax=Pacificispira sp. TaxID=2888761 RepID=UPI002EAD33AF|nr:undecaprenyldiphospho-muramoylpentapeptide beta-N-acetylglucosaminyltransferase [Pseudomonadota bacterium]
MTGDNLIVLATGGTGGHVFPAQALAGELKNRGYRLALITDRRGDAYSGPLGELDAHTISAAGVSGKGISARISAVLKLMVGYFQARSLLRAMRPSVVVGFGGYPSVPTMLAASHLKIRTAIHEQNAVLGRANRLMAGRVDRIALSFNETDGLAAKDRGRSVLTGNPVRPEIAALSGRPFRVPAGDEPLHILIVGGSQGAQILGEAVPAAMAKLPDSLKPRLKVEQQARPEQTKEVIEAYRQAGIDADVRTFFDDMPVRLERAHLMIGRAGASTLAEVTAVGLPAILIPYAYAIDDHQAANAARLSDAGGAWAIPQRDVTADDLARRLEQLLGNPSVLGAAAQAAARTGIPDATKRLADAVQALSDGNGGNSMKEAA